MTEDQSLYAAMQELSGATFASANHVGDLITLDLRRVAKERGVALPTSGDTDRETYHGAVVFDAKSGLHYNVCYPDYSALYPNIMRDLNASPETILGVGESTLVRSDYDRSELQWSYIDPRPVKRLADHETYSDFTSGTYKIVYDPNQQTIKWRDDWSRIQEHLEPIYFCPHDEWEGLLTARADDYIRWNKSYTGTMYAATKRTRNGLYGVSGDSNFQLFDWRVAEGITIAGRLLLEFGASTIRERLQSTFDADSVYVTHGDSVPADEPVLVRGEAGTVSVKPAHYVHERVTSGESLDTWTEAGWTPIRRSIQKTSGKQMYEVRTKAGTVRVTEDHSLVSADGTEVSPEDVDVGDSLLLSDVRGALPSRDERARLWSDEGAWLLGLFVADGTAGAYEYEHRSNKYSWSITNENRERLERAADTLEGGWGIQSEIRDIRTSTNAWRLQVAGNGWGEVITRDERGRVFGRGSGGRKQIVNEFFDRCYVDGEKRVPPSILNGIDAEREAFLAGYLEGDGGESPYGVSEIPDEMTTKSRVLATGLAMLIRNEGHQVTVDRQYRHGNTYHRLRAVTYHRGDPAEVTDVDTVDYDGNHVYDFETENHHFHAGVGSIVVHNTDGFGIAVNQDVTRGHVLPRVRDAVEWLNETGMPEYVEETFGVPTDETAHEIDLESYSPRLFIPADDSGGGTKKTYAEHVTWDEGEECDDIDITGFEAKRSDVADITADVQTDVLESVLTEPRLSAKQTVYERIRQAVEAVEDGVASRSYIGQRSGLSKPPEEYGSAKRRAQPIYRGAKYAKANIEGEQEFDKPMKFPVARIHDPYPTTYDTDTAEDGDMVDWIAVEDPDSIPPEIDIDREMVVQKTLRQPLRRILQTMGWSWSEAVHGHEQTRVADYIQQ